MDSIVFHVDADKIGPNLASSIKAYFGNRRVRITVTPDETADEATTDNETVSENYALPYDDIARISEALDRDEPIDVVAEMKKFMEVK